MRKLLVGISIALFVSACGSPAETESALDALQSAADKVEGAGSARMAMSMSMAGESLPVTEANTTGVMDFENKRGKMQMRMELPLIGPTVMTMLNEGLVAYMKAPYLEELLPPGVDWVRLDMQALGNESGFDFEALTQLGGGTDPTQFLQYMRGASDDVREIGREMVGDVMTTHYHATLDLERAAENAPEEVREAARQSIELLESMLESDMPVDVWLDDSGLMRKMTSQYTMNIPNAGRMDVDLTMSLWDFGVDVRVKIPPEGKTIDFQQLMEQSGSL
ncbi:MAG: hypothetical protein QOG54_2430 [Actinomycetota bacterium]|jgi:hypothetical protein|nr:hypothetical protein [Actinomycetota bacterium]